MPAGPAKAVDYAFGEPSLALTPVTTFTYPSAPLPSGLSLGVEDRTVRPPSERRTVSLPNRTTEQTFYSEWLLVNGGAVGQRGAAGSRSELFSAYNTALDADRSALPVTDHALMLGQTDLEYEVTRVKSPVLGRDLNPMGRGDGAYFPNGGNIMGGSLRIGSVKPRSLGQVTFGYGSSINNRSEGGPPPWCFGVCFCYVICMVGWARGIDPYPSDCCDDEEAMQTAFECCATGGHSYEEFKSDCFGCEEDAEKPGGECCHVELKCDQIDHGLTYCPGEPTVPGNGGKWCLLREDYCWIDKMWTVDCDDPSATHGRCRWVREYSRWYYIDLRSLFEIRVKWLERETHCPSGETRIKSVGGGGGAVNPPID